MTKLPSPEAQNLLVKIGDTAKLVGVSIDTLRRWEKKGFISPIKTPGGTRLYDLDQIQKLNPRSSITGSPSSLLDQAEPSLPSITYRPSTSNRAQQRPINLRENLSENQKSNPINNFEQFKYIAKNQLPVTMAIIIILVAFLFTGTFGFITLINHNISKDSKILPSFIDSLTKSNLSSVLGESTPSGKFLEINTDTKINGALFGRTLDLSSDETIGGLLNVTGAANFASSITGLTLNITSPTQQIILGTGNTVTIDTTPPTGSFLATIPALSADDTFLFTTQAQTLTNKTISGAANTLTNIGNTSLVNNKVTISTSGILSGGGDVNLGSSLTLSVSAISLSSSSVTGVLAIANGGTNSTTTPTAGAVSYGTGTAYAFTAAGTTGQVLSSNGSGTPTWISVAAASCPTCVLTDPSVTQTITPTATTAIGLSVAQASSGSVDIFNVTSNGGGTKYLKVDSSGNLTVSAIASISSSSATALLTISPSGATGTGLAIGALSGATANTGISIGAITSAATANNFGINMGAITSQASATSYAINTGAISGAGTATYGINLGANSSTATTNYGINVGAISGAGTTNYGLYVGAVSGATSNYAAIFARGNVGVGITTPTAQLDVLAVAASTGFNLAGTAPASVAPDGTNAATYTMLVVGTAGGATSGAMGQTGGTGGALSLTAGAGGAASNGTSYGGLAGAVTIAGGTGGNAPTTGGAGGAVSVTAGNAGTGGNANGGTLTLNSGNPTGTGTSAINIGTTSSLRAITIGNATGATSLALNSGTGTQTFTSQVVSGTTTSSGFIFDATAITSGTGLYMTTDSVTSGKLLDIATTGNTWTGNSTTTGLVNLASTSTAGTASDSDILLKIARSGTNDNASHTAYGVYTTIANTGTTSVNVGGLFSATGATTNRGLEVAAMTGATSTGLTIGALSGTTADTGISIGAISGTGATGAGVTVGNISTTGTTNYGLQLGTMTGATTSNYQISTGVLTSATTTTNAQINLGGVVTTGGTTNYGINVGALSGTGTTNYGQNISTLTSTGTTNYGLNIGGATGAATTNYGLVVGTVSGATTNYGALLQGTWFTGGSATTTKPQLLVEPSGTTSTGWSTSGTGLGVNSAQTFAGNLMDLQQAGLSTFKIAGVSTAVNGFTFQTAATTNGVSMSATGSDTNIALTLSSKGTGAINLGTDASAKTITIGNATGATALALNSGTGSQTFTSKVVSGTTTTSAFVFDGGDLTTGTGAYFTSDSITQGKLVDITPTGNTLTSGTLLNLTSTATSLTSGRLLSLDWTPGSATTATGDLFRLTIGTNGTTTGNLFNIVDTSSSIFSVSETALTTSLPSNFTAAGDVSVAYDLFFTNPTASYITSAAPLYLRAGETFNSSNLTLSTYNFGTVLVDSTVTTSAAASTKYALQINTGDTTTTADTIYGLYSTNALTGAAAKVGYGFYSTLTSSSTTADTLYGVYSAITQSGASTSGTKAAYGIYSAPTTTGANTSTAVINLYGSYLAPSSTTSTTATVNVYGQYISNTATVTSTGTVNNYGLYIANGTSDTTGTNTKIGINLEPMASADENIGICFDCDSAYGTSTVATGIQWGNETTTTQNLRMFRSNGAAAAQLTVEDEAGTDILNGSLSAFQINLDDTATYTEWVCHNGSDGATGLQSIGDCNQAGAGDLAEYYGSDGSLEAGDLVIADPNRSATSQMHDRYGYISKAFVTKNTKVYQSQILGIISTNPVFYSLSKGALTDEEHPVVVSLTGRVPLKVSIENGPVQIGDYLTSSSTPGVAMKATQPGQVVGKALESYNNVGSGKIIVFVNVTYADPSNVLANLTLDSTGQLIIPSLKVGQLVLDSNLAPDAQEATGSGTLAYQIMNLENRVRDLENQPSANSSQPSDFSTLINNIAAGQQAQNDSLATLQNDINASNEAVAGVSAQVASQSASLAAQSVILEGATRLIGSSSAQLNQQKDSIATLQNDNLKLRSDINYLNLTPPDILLATGSATLANINVSEKISTLNLEAYESTVSGTFRSLGMTYLGQTNVAGDITQDGMLSITQGSTINALPILYLQNSFLAEGIDLFNSKVTIDKTGLVSLEKLAISAETLGTATISAGSISVAVPTTKLTDKSKVFTTSNRPLPIGIVKDVQNGLFYLEIATPQSQDMLIDWWIVDTR